MGIELKENTSTTYYDILLLLDKEEELRYENVRESFGDVLLDRPIARCLPRTWPGAFSLPSAKLLQDGARGVDAFRCTGAAGGESSCGAPRGRRGGVAERHAEIAALPVDDGRAIDRPGREVLGLRCQGLDEGAPGRCSAAAGGAKVLGEKGDAQRESGGAQ